MTWFKVDDGFSSSKKVLSIPRTQRLAAVGLWTMAGNWSAKELTDGVVPKYVLDELGATPKLIQALIDARLWDDGRSTEARSRLDGTSAEAWSSAGDCGPCIVFHNWPKYQPTRDGVEEERRKSAERQARWRDRHKGETGESPVSNDVTDAFVERPSPVSNSAPTRPDPTRTTSNEVVGDSSSSVADAPTRPDVDRICQHLADRIEANGSKRPTITKAWHDEARRLLDLDEREEASVIRAIDWCQGDPFWRSNVLSMPTLRKKYDQLRLAAQREQTPAASARPTTDDKVREALDRARALAALEQGEQQQIEGAA